MKISINNEKPSISISSTDTKYHKLCKGREALRIAGHFDLSHQFKNEFYMVDGEREELIVLEKYLNVVSIDV
jgi:hypothetical protein